MISRKMRGLQCWLSTFHKQTIITEARLKLVDFILIQIDASATIRSLWPEEFNLPWA